MTLGERVFRLLLFVYPRHFRRRYRDDLVAFFLAERANHRSHDRSGGLRFWGEVVWDLVRVAVDERVHPKGQRQGWSVRRSGRPTVPTAPIWENVMENLLQDIRFSMRSLWKNPGFFAVAVATLALGIGTNATVFAVVNSVVFDELPYPEDHRVFDLHGGDIENTFSLSENERLWFLQERDIFAAFGTYSFNAINLQGPDGSERVIGASVDPEVFEALRTGIRLGRGFTDAEMVVGGPDVAILSYATWQQRYQGSPTVLGQELMLVTGPATIVGVTAPGFRLPGDFIGEPVQVYRPLRIGEPDPRNIHYLSGVARLRDGVSFEQARARLALLAPQMREALPMLPETFSPRLVPIREVVLGDVRPILFILLGSVGLVLLIACVNVANLFLARSEGRSRELGVRVALGASRGRLLRQLLTESTLVGIVGGSLGLALAMVATNVIRQWNPPNVPRFDQIQVGGPVVLFTFVATMGAVLLFGAMPAMMASRANVRQVLHEGGRGGTGGAGRQMVRRVLVVSEVGLAVTLAIGAGLLVRSLDALMRVDAGINASSVLTLRVTLSGDDYQTTQSIRSFHRDLLTSLRGLPSVEAAGATTALPLASSPGDWGIRIEGREEERLPSGRRPFANRITVTDGYHEALHVPIVQGRGLRASDDQESELVVLVNEETARRYWPDETALGQRFYVSTEDSVYRTIVGVVGDVRHAGLSGDVEPEMYLPLSQSVVSRSMTLTVRTTREPLALTADVRRAIASVGPTVAVSGVQTMSQVMSASTASERLSVTLFSVFGVFGLLLVSVGVYGVMSYFVSLRTKELAIRVALGAAPRTVRGLIVGNGLTLALVGGGVGILGALALGKTLSTLLFGVAWYDPATFLSIPILVGGVAVAACVVPAFRATRVDPLSVLREP